MSSVLSWQSGSSTKDRFLGWIKYNTPLEGTGQPLLTFKTPNSAGTRGAGIWLSESTGDADGFFGSSLTRQFTVTGTPWNTVNAWQQINVAHCLDSGSSTHRLQVLHLSETETACNSITETIPDADWLSNSGFYLGFSEMPLSTTSDLSMSCAGYMLQNAFGTTLKDTYNQLQINCSKR